MLQMDMSNAIIESTLYEIPVLNRTAPLQSQKERSMYTIVVADDEEELRRALVRRVDWESAGFHVVGEAENGAEALELVEKLEPDLLLTDIQMPFVNGLELAKQVREIRPNIHIAFLSGYDEFAYAQQAIQYNIISYMLKPISAAEMTAELAKIKEKMDEKFRQFAASSQESMDISAFLMPLLLDEFQEEANEGKDRQLKETAVSCGLLNDAGNDMGYTVMVVKITDDAGKNCTSATNVNAIDMILRKYIKHASFYANGKVVSLLTATRRGFDKYLHILVEDIIQSVKQIMGLPCYVGLSRIVMQLASCHEAYVEASNAISYSQRKGSSVHFISDVERADDFDQTKAQNAISEIENLIRAGSRQDMEDWLEGLFHELKNRQVTPVTLSFLMIQLVSAVFRIVHAVTDGEPVRELQLHSPIREQILFDSSEEAWGKYKEFFLMAEELVSEQRKKSREIICDRALKLIETRYMDQELSLVSISNEIAVSPNYLSALIKKSTGSTFVDTLTRKRIEMAKELLYCTSLKIKDISEKCGYSDQHYFSYCFKKYTGISPNACRRQNGEAGEQA